MPMSRIRTSVVVLALLALTVPFIAGAASEPEPEEGVGTASSSLIGATLGIDDGGGVLSGELGELLGTLASLDELGLDGIGVDLGLLEGTTEATTVDAPDAHAWISPLRLGEDRPHDVSAGPGEQQGGDATSSVPGGLLSGIGLSPYSVHADTDEAHAVAVIEALDASLDLLGESGLDLGLTGVVSEVTSTEAVATQDLAVDGLLLELGDILPADLLAALPLDALLEVVHELEVAGLLDADGLRDRVHGLVAEIAGILDGLDPDAIGDLGDLDPALLDELQDLLGLLDGLEDLDLDDTLSAAEVSAAGTDGQFEAQLLGGVVDGLTGLLDGDDGDGDGDGDDGDANGDDEGDGSGGTGIDLLDGLTDVEDLLSVTVDELQSALGDLADGDLDDLGLLGLLEGDLALLEEVAGLLVTAESLLDTSLACLDGTGDELLGLLDDPTTTLGDLLDATDGLEACLADVLAEVETAIDDLLGDITDQLGLGDVLDELLALIGGLAELDALLGQLPGLIGDITEIDLLGADSMGLDVAATADADGGETTVECRLGGLVVLEQLIGDTACSDGAIDGEVDGAVDQALGVLEDVLNALPGVSVSGLGLDVLPVADESVTTDDDGTVTARAHAVLLRLDVPSVTISPSPSGLLDDLLDIQDGLGVVGEVTGAIEDLLDGTGLDDVLPAEQVTLLVDELLAEVEAVLGGLPLQDVLDEVTGLLGAVLDNELLDALGIEISTPELFLELDPVSEATFTPASAASPGAPDDPADDDPAGDPVPTDDRPELPRTGGGLALMGLLAMLGAVGIRRMTG